MRAFLLKISLFLILFAFVAGVFDTLYFKVRMETLYPELVHLDKLLEEEVEVILLGSSVNRYTDSLDTDKRSIDAMLADLLPERKVGAISHTAYHMDIFLELARYISRQDHKPLLIIPINVRTLCPAWDLRPTYQFTFEKHLINNAHLFRRFIDMNKDVEKELQDFKEYPVYHQKRLIGQLQEFTAPYAKLTDPTKGFIFHYLQPISPDNQKIVSFENLLSNCEEHGIPYLIYFTPLDYTSAEALQIPGFQEGLATNLSLFEEVIQLHEAEDRTLDLSFSLDSAYFSYPILPNEHLTQAGRMFVAAHLRDKINTAKALN